MSRPNWKNIDAEGPWIFIPLKDEDAAKVYFWIKRLGRDKEEDESLAKDCEASISEAFDRLEIVYDSKQYGDVKMENMRLYSGSDGVAIPETCFIKLSSKLIRINNPLRPLTTN